MRAAAREGRRPARRMTKAMKSGRRPTRRARPIPT